MAGSKAMLKLTKLQPHLCPTKYSDKGPVIGWLSLSTMAKEKICQFTKRQQLWAAADCLSVAILWQEGPFENCNTREVVSSICSKPEALGYHIHHNSQQTPKSAQPASDKFSFRDSATVQLMLMGPWSTGRKRTTSLNHEKIKARLHCVDLCTNFPREEVSKWEKTGLIRLKSGQQVT
jgi:hypothetical protein